MVNQLQVIWKRLYNSKSSIEKGTLYQLRNVLNRTSVPADPVINMKATEDLFRLVLYAHIVAATKTVLNSESSCLEIAKRVVNEFISIDMIDADTDDTDETSESDDDDDGTSNDNSNGVGIDNQKDGVQNYARDILKIGLFWLTCSYYDAIKEGDGDRIILLWKFLLVILRELKERTTA